MLNHQHTPAWTVTLSYMPRLISALEWRGWYKASSRSGRGVCRMWRNDEYIAIGQEGAIVAHGPTAEEVLRELARTEAVQW